MTEPVAGLRSAADLITSALDQASEMTALVRGCAPAVEVALAATVLQGLAAEIARLRLLPPAVEAVWEEAHAAGVAAGRAAVLAEQAAAVHGYPPLRLMTAR